MAPAVARRSTAKLLWPPSRHELPSAATQTTPAADMASPTAATLKSTRVIRRCPGERKHEITSASNDAVIVAGAGPTSSSVVNVKVSEIEKLTGAARIFSVAKAPPKVSAQSTPHRGSSASHGILDAARATVGNPMAVTTHG
jgi:hypothetical protein